MKTKEELNTLKNEVETMNKNLAELTEGELKQVAGGRESNFSVKPPVLPDDTIQTIIPIPYVVIGPDWEKPDTKMD